MALEIEPSHLPGTYVEVASETAVPPFRLKAPSPDVLRRLYAVGFDSQLLQGFREHELSMLQLTEFKFRVGAGDLLSANRIELVLDWMRTVIGQVHEQSA